MLPTEQSPAQMRARIARASRTGDDTEAAAARTDYAVAKLEEQIRRVISAAPPLTEAQRDRLRSLLATDQ